MKDSLYVGIDLGTTNSECYVKCGSNPIEALLVPEAKQSEILNSVVKYENGEFKVGNYLKDNVDEYNSSWKLLKTHLDTNLSYDTNGNESNAPFPASITPEKFSEQILRVFKREIDKKYPNYPIANLVITVPANFRDSARRLVKKAAFAAGFDPKDVFTLINEPTSAALSYGYELQSDKKIIAFDLGGGTFDVTLLDYTLLDDKYRFYQAIATDGTNIGGRDFDKAISEIAYKKFIDSDGKEYAGDNAFKDAFVSQFQFKAESLKIALSRTYECDGTMTVNYRGERVFVDVTINNDEFHRAIDSMIDETIRLTKLVASGFEDRIDSLILVGGSTKMPYIKQRLQKEFKFAIKECGNPDLIVALGACLHADTLGDHAETSNSVLNEILSNPIGNVVHGGFIANIVPAGSSIPCSVTKSFYGTRIDQEQIQCNITNGKGLLFEDPRLEYLGNQMISNLKKEGIKPKIDVKIDVNSDSTIDLTIISKSDERNTASAKLSLTNKRNSDREEYGNDLRDQFNDFCKYHPNFDFEKQFKQYREEFANNIYFVEIEKAMANTRVGSFERNLYIYRLICNFDSEKA